MDKLEALRSFVTVVDTGSFAQAARRLRCSPAAVTRAVTQVEKEVGLGLLTRTTRSVRPTEGGAIYAERCRRLLSELADAQRAARGERASPQGELTIAAPIMFGRLHVARMVEELLATHPHLAVRLVLSDRLARLIEEGINVAVRIGELAESGMIAIPVAAVRSVLVASPAYLDSHGRPKTIADLRDHQIIEFEALGGTNTWRLGTEGEQVKVAPRLSINCAASAVAAAEHGVGITRAFSYHVQASIDQGLLERVLPRIVNTRLPMHLVYPANRRGAPNIAAFTTVVRKHVKTAAGVETIG